MIGLGAAPETEARMRAHERFESALDHLGRADIERGLQEAEYAIRLDPIHLALFLRKSLESPWGRDPLVRRFVERWARQWRERQTRGYS